MPQGTGSTTDFTKVCVYRTGGLDTTFPGSPAQDHDDILELACTKNNDASNRDVAQDLAPAIAVAQGTVDGPRVEVTHRSPCAAKQSAGRT